MNRSSKCTVSSRRRNSMPCLSSGGGRQSNSTRSISERGRRVSFDENATKFGSQQQVSKEEADLIWYSKKEYQSMQLNNVSDLLGCGLARGLERYHMDICNVTKSELQINHIQSILNLQQDQKDAGIDDANGLKSLSLALSKHTKMEAKLRAEKDSIETFRTNKKSPYIKATNAKEYARCNVTRRPLSRSKTYEINTPRNNNSTATTATATPTPKQQRYSCQWRLN